MSLSAPSAYVWELDLVVEFVDGPFAGFSCLVRQKCASWSGHRQRRRSTAMALGTKHVEKINTLISGEMMHEKYAPGDWQCPPRLNKTQKTDTDRNKHKQETGARNEQVNQRRFSRTQETSVRSSHDTPRHEASK